MTTLPYLAITASCDGQETVLRLEGELDVCNKDQLHDAISAALSREPSLLVIDLSALDFMDCSGLSVLIWAGKRLAEQRGRLLVTGCQPIVRRLFSLIRPDITCAE